MTKQLLWGAENSFLPLQLPLELVELTQGLVGSLQLSLPSATGPGCISAVA